MMQGTAVATTVSPDVVSRLKMFRHHQDAIEGARIALQYAFDSSTKAMRRRSFSCREGNRRMQASLDKNEK